MSRSLLVTILAFLGVAATQAFVVPQPKCQSALRQQPLSMVRRSSEEYLSSFLGLDGKVALVTGSTGGLGRSIAETLLQAGCTVFINGRKLKSTQQAVDEIAKLVEDEGRVFAAAGDTSDVKDTCAIVEEIKSKVGKLDILVNNAGINLPEAPFEEQYSPDSWGSINKVNIEGPMNMSKETLPLLKKSPAGRIINVSSMIGHVGNGDNSLYCLTKGAMLLFTKSLAADMAGKKDSRNLTVNSVSPGIFMTEMNAKFTEEKEKLASVEATVPMKRLGKPEELAGAVLYLASDASSYTMGADLLVDGGFVAV
ncbi:unnamed protein product [Cylindrotheca closterium]|uniref:Uncharacterized protein n=1 Tax=Cylindrotheca closterium TaxID=2856 RepID=A0AAD2PVG6_9STRA|nr:unnamed protein product [Cylindrotheca closterium]